MGPSLARDPGDRIYGLAPVDTRACVQLGMWSSLLHQYRLSTIVVVLLSSSPAWPDVEAARLPLARERIPAIAERYTDISTALANHLITATTSAARERFARLAAQTLWQRSTSEVQSGLMDDRPLYWARLALHDAVIRSVDEHRRAPLLAIIERHSRGLSDVAFPTDSRWRILITGFDPFHLDREIAQSNPSGLAALSFDGLPITHGDRTGQIETALIPVRFEDFDNGLIETFLAEQYRRHNLSLVVTISMGRDQFDLERFPGRRRSADSPDNRNIPGGGSAGKPSVPRVRGDELQGPEFVEFSLPATAMRKAQGDWSIRDNRTVQTLERGTFEASSLADLSLDTAVRGSGGGYLSNEISYRSIVLRNTLKQAFAVGHIHTPSVPGYSADAERRIVEQVRQMLQQALGAL